MQLYPLEFEANRHPALWGGEEWVASAHPAGPGVVANGELKGRTLDALAAEFGRALMGSRAADPTRFPLLFKVIDAHDRLSVQVHPNEANRALTGGEPKTEMWYVLPGSGGPIFAGLRPGVDAAAVEEAVRTGSFEDKLCRYEARPGDCFFIPGGLVHAIGERVRVFEVQQSSNTTYRLYDWGRVGKDGRPRQLHVAESLQTIDFTLPPPTPAASVACDFFRFRAVQARESVFLAANPETFTLVHVVESGHTVLVPAGVEASIPASGTVLLATL